MLDHMPLSQTFLHVLDFKFLPRTHSFGVPYDLLHLLCAPQGKRKLLDAHRLGLYP